MVWVEPIIVPPELLELDELLELELELDEPLSPPPPPQAAMDITNIIVRHRTAKVILDLFCMDIPFPLKN